MRPEAARAERDEAVRAAARDWREAGVLGEDGLKAVEGLYPDDRVRVGPVFRVLLFLFTLLGALATAGLLYSLMEESNVSDAGPYALASGLLGLLAVGLTEWQTGPLKRTQGGTEAATSFAALILLTVGWGAFFFGTLDADFEDAFSLFIAPVALGFLLAAWRWGYPLYGGFAAAGLLEFFAHLPLGVRPELAQYLVPGVRIAWIVAGLAAAVFLPRALDSRQLPPSLRDAATAALLVFLAGLYLAVDISSVSGYWVEAYSLFRFGGLPPPPPPAPLRYLSLLATVLVPALLLAWGLLRRRRPVLLMGLLLAAGAGVSVRRYIHVAPLWVVLTLSGLTLLALALGLRRYLDGGEGKERFGFTADPPLGGEERTRLLELIGTVATLTPAARDLPADPAYQGKGGEFGGGGSNSDF